MFRKHRMVSYRSSWLLLTFIASAAPYSTTALLASASTTALFGKNLGLVANARNPQLQQHADNKRSSSSCITTDDGGFSAIVPRDIHYDDAAANALKNLRLYIGGLQQIREKEKQKEKNLIQVSGGPKNGRQSSAPTINNDNRGNNEIVAGALQELGSSGDWEKTTMTLIGYKGGPMKSQVNQDRSIVVSPLLLPPLDDSSSEAQKAAEPPAFEERIAFLGVLDGHGFRGEIVSEYARTEIPKRLAAKFRKLYSDTYSSGSSSSDNNEGDTNNRQGSAQQQQQLSLASLLNSNVTVTKKIITDTFLEVDESTPAGEDGGCSCSMAIQIGRKVYMANIGDSITIIARYRELVEDAAAAEDAVQVLYQTREDKPDLPDELARIEAAGGEVYTPEGDSSRVLFEKDGHQVGLAMSRSIGDHSAPGVIAAPIIDVFDIPALLSGGGTNNPSKNHLFLVSFSDGMADYITSHDVANFMAKSLYGNNSDNNKLQMHPHNAAEQLIYIASKGWTRDMGGQYRDDITIAASTIVWG